MLGGFFKADSGSKGGGVIVLITSLLLSFVVWSLMKLSYSYNSVYHYKVELETALPQRVFNSLSDGAVTIKGSSTGFNIIRHKIGTKRNSNVLSLKSAPENLTQDLEQPDRFFILAPNLYDALNEALRCSMNIDEVVNDTLFFNFPKTFNKKVPVSLLAKFIYKEQYMAYGKPLLRPDSVEIHGEQSKVKHIDSVATESIVRTALTSDAQGVVKLAKMDGLSYSADEIYYMQRGGRFVEQSMEVPVMTLNVPAGIRLITSPAVVKVTVRLPYAAKEVLDQADFALSVDYEQIIASPSGKAIVQVARMPKGVLNIKVEPMLLDNIAVSR